MDASDDITHWQLRIGLYEMETTEVIGIGREAIWTVIYVAGPVLIIALRSVYYRCFSGGNLYSGNDAQLYSETRRTRCCVIDFW